MGPLDLFDLVSLRPRCHRPCALNVRLGTARLRKEPCFRIPETYFYSIGIVCSEGETVSNITSWLGSGRTDPDQSCDTAKPLLSAEAGRGSTWRWRWNLNSRYGVALHDISSVAPSADRTRHPPHLYLAARPAGQSTILVA